MIPELFLETVRQQIVLSKVIGHSVRLVRKGRTFGGLCPFHQEKTSSFVVDDSRSTYTCYGCGARGDVFDFLKASRNLSFHEAVEVAADIAGLAMPKVTPDTPTAASNREALSDLYALLERACAYFQQQLEKCPQAQVYLKRRGLTAGEIVRFRLGYAPEGGILAAAQHWGYLEEQLEAAGLCGRSSYGQGLFERFRGRVMFPIMDRRQRVVGFGGRALGDEQPKYLNSPETALFHKSKLLYWAHPVALPGTAGALPSPRSLEQVLVVEGYMDALAASRLMPAAAPLGTAMTLEQLQALWRFTDQPIVCLDGDAAGQRASLRIAHLALPGLEPGKSLRFMALPGGKDPGDLLLQGIPAHITWFQDQATKAMPLVDFLWQSLFAQALNSRGLPEQRAQAVQKWKEAVKTIVHPDVRRFYEDVLTERLNAHRAAGQRMPWKTQSLPKHRGKSPHPQPSQEHPLPVAVDLPLRLLVGALVVDGDLRASVQDQAAQLQGPQDNIWLQILADVLSLQGQDCTGLLDTYFGAQAGLHKDTLARHLPPCPQARAAYWGELFNAYHTQVHQRHEIEALQDAALEGEEAWHRLKTLTQL